MDTSTEYDEEVIAVPLIPRPGIPTAIKDTRKPYQKQLAVYIILASTFFERFAFFTLAANLTFNLESDNTKLSSLGPNTISYIFYGVSYFSAIIFAIVSDAKFGRGKTIVVGFIIYLTGYMIGSLLTNGVFGKQCEELREDMKNKSSCVVWIYAIIFTIALGSGIVQSGIPVFGAEQIQQSKINANYFDKYTVVSNISAILAVFIIRNTYQINDNGYGIPAIVATSCIGMAAVLFVAGWKFYIHIPPFDTVLINCFPVTFNAFHTWWRSRKNGDRVDRGRLNSVSSYTMSGIHDDYEDEQPPSFLDYAKAAYNGKYPDRIVDDVKSLQMASVVFFLYIPFGLIHSQLNSTFAVQAKYMNESHNYQHDNTWLSDRVSLIWAGNPVIIIAGVLILNLFVYKRLRNQNRSLTIPTRFIIGMCFAVLSMCAAGTVEKFRQDGCHQTNSYNESSLLVYYQLPQNILLGLGELFASIASFDYAYFCSPRSGHSLFMSLRFCSLGVASFISIGYITLFSRSSKSNKLNFSCPREENEPWHFISYFFILGGIQCIFIILLIICQKKFRIVKINPQQVETNQFVHQVSML